MIIAPDKIAISDAKRASPFFRGLREAFGTGCAVAGGGGRSLKASGPCRYRRGDGLASGPRRLRPADRSARSKSGQQV